MDEPKCLALKDIVANYPKDTSILDVGFGDGEFLKALHKLGYYNLFGVEVSEKCINEIRKHKELDDIFLYLANTPRILTVLNPEIVCCFEVIEHLHRPIPFLEKLPGEVLYLSTPNIDRWYPKLFGKFEKWDYPPNHLHRFDSHRLYSDLVESGWTKFRISRTIIRHHEILRSLFSKKVESGDYDTARPKRKWLTSNIRRALIPFTWTFAALLSLKGYDGVSFYVKAKR